MFKEARGILKVSAGLFLEMTTEVQKTGLCLMAEANGFRFRGSAGVNLGVHLGHSAEVDLFAVVMVSTRFKIETNKKSLTKPPATTALVLLL